MWFEGGLQGTLGGRRTAVGAGDCLVLDLREIMRVDLTEHRCLTLVVP